VNEAFVAERLQVLARRVETYNQQVVSLASPQVALALLRLCAGPTKVAHVLRCLPPDMTSALAEAVDASTRKSLLGIMQVENMSPLQWRQAQLPLSMSGLGLASVASTKEAAFLASVSAVSMQPSLLQSVGSIYPKECVISALTNYNSRVAPSDEIKEADFCKKLGNAVVEQRELTGRIHRRTFDLLLRDASLDHFDLCRIKEQTLAGTSCWMTPVYVGSRPVIESSLFPLLVRRHLGCTFFTARPDLNVPCSRGQVSHVERRKECNVMQDPRLYHATDLCRTAFVHRHNTLSDCLKRLCRRADIACLSEVACIPGSNEVPADLYIHVGPNGVPLAVDVSITTPLHGLDRQPKSAPGVNLSKREREKVHMYGDLFRRMNGSIQFSPFVMSTCASFGPRARQFCMFIAAKLALRWRIKEQVAKAYVITHLSATLMQFIGVSLSQAVHCIPVLP
jgi:hypothetical protein